MSPRCSVRLGGRSAGSGGRIIAATPFEAWLGKVFDGSDALGDIRDVLAWSKHDSALQTELPPYLHLRLSTLFGTLAMLTSRHRAFIRLHPLPGHARRAGGADRQARRDRGLHVNQIKTIIDVLRQMMENPPEPPKGRIGFQPAPAK